MSLNRGIVMVEILIALAIFALTMAAVIMMSAAARTTPNDLERERAALEDAASRLEEARASSAANFAGIIGTSGTTSLAVLDLSPCLKQVTGTALYETSTHIAQTIALSTLTESIDEYWKMGGDCPAAGDGNFSSEANVPLEASTNALDLLDGTAYIATVQAPYLAVIENVDGSIPAMRDNFANGFSLPTPANALDAIVVHDAAGTTHRYIYAALASTSTQLAVVDATDPAAPVITAMRSLANVDPIGSQPQGWRIRYYNGDLYITTRETSGRELHIFDARKPAAPIEMGAGTELGITINDFSVRDQGANASTKRYLFAATSWVSGELAVYDVTDAEHTGAAREVVPGRTKLGGDQNAESIALLGPRLYLGRAITSSGPELYAFDASDPTLGLPLLGSAEAGKEVSMLRASGSYLYALTKNPGKEIEIWNVASTAAMTLATSAPLTRASAMDFDETILAAITGGAATLRLFFLQ